MPSTQKGLVTGLSVCDRDSVVICTWSALPPTCDVAWAPINGTGWGEMTVCSCWSISLHQMWPLLKWSRPSDLQRRVLVCMLVRIFVRGWRGGRGVEDACLTTVWEDVYDVVRTHMTFLVVCAQTEEICLWRGVFGKWNQCMCECAFLCQTLILTLMDHR